MKQRKRMISILLVLSMILSLLPVSAFAEGDRFTDVKPTNWFYNAVEYVCENGIMSGTGKTTFGPNETTTRGMIVTVLYNMEGKPAVSGNVFNDVEDKAYYKNAVTWASANGIVSGYGAGKFGPKDAITREQMAAILFNYAKFKGYDTSVTSTLSGFSDIGKISSYAVKAVTWAVEKGLISGMGDNRIEPKGTALRAQVAVILMQFNNKIANGGTVVPPKQDTNVKVDQNEGATPPANSNSGGVNHTVTFELIFSEFVSNKAAFSAQMVADGAAMTKPVDPVLPLGYFDGWYTDPTYEKVFDFNTKIKEDMVLYAKWAVDKTDSDKEGLYDDVEDYMGLNKNNPDTDGDGVDDYTELTAGTDPLKNDGSGDVDGDGLSNAEEAKLGTSLTGSDSDFDGLTDKEEVKTYKTDPLKEDTDGDGAEDGWEVLNGFDPLSANKTFEVKQSLGKVSKDNPVAASVTTSLKGEQADTLEMDIVTYADNPLISAGIPGYLGVAYDFTVEGEIGEATLEFKYDKSLGKIGDDFQPRIYYLNEEDGLLEELKNQTVKDGVVTAGVEHFSTYILLNKVEFDKVWETDIKPADEREQKKAMDVTFVIDYSYSMVSNDPDGLAKKLATEFVDKLRDKDEAAVIKFMQKPKVLKKLTDDKEALKKAIAEIEYDPSKGTESGVSGTNGSYGLKKAVELMLEEAYSPKKHIIFITDGEDTHYGENVNWMNQDRAPTAAQLKGQKKAYEEVIALAKEYDINIFTVRIGAASEDILKWIADSTGGKYFDATLNLEESLDKVEGELIDFYTDSNEDGISDYHTKMILEGDLTLGNGSNYFEGIDLSVDKDVDGDGLKNGLELEVVEENGRVYLKMYSDPLMKNSDLDEVDDYTEYRNGSDRLKYTYEIEDVGYLNNDFNFYHTNHFLMHLHNYDNGGYEVASDGGDFNTILAGAYYGVWDRNEIARDIIIDYIYEYSSTISEKAEELEKRRVIMGLIDQIGAKVSEYDYELDDIDMGKVNVGANIVFLPENLAGFINTLLRREQVNLDGLLSELNNVGKGIVKKDWSKVTFSLKNIKCNNLRIGEVTYPAISNDPLIRSNTVAFFTIDVLNGVQDCNDTVKSIAKINANIEQFNACISMLECLRDTTKYKYIREAADTVIKGMDQGMYENIVAQEKNSDIMNASVNGALTLIASKITGIGAAKWFRDGLDMVFGFSKDVTMIQEMRVYGEMASACELLVDEVSHQCAGSFDAGKYYYCEDEDITLVRKHLSDLVQLRMLGERKYLDYYKDKEDGFVYDFVKELTGTEGDLTLAQRIKSSVHNVRAIATRLDLEFDASLLI